MDNAKGMYPTEAIYDDSNIAQIESISETQPHRDVDLTIIEADKQGEKYRLHMCFDTTHGVFTQVS